MNGINILKMESKQIIIKNWIEDIENIEELNIKAKSSKKALEFFGISISKDIVIVPKDFNLYETFKLIEYYYDFITEVKDYDSKLDQYLEAIDYKNCSYDEKYDYFGLFIEEILELIDSNSINLK